MVGGSGLLSEPDDPSPAISHFSDSSWTVGGVCPYYLTHSAHLAQVHCSDQRTRIHRMPIMDYSSRLDPEQLRKKQIFQSHLQNAINISDFEGIAHWEKIVSEKYYFQVINNDISHLSFTPVFWHHMTGLLINQFLFFQTIRGLINVLIWIRDYIQKYY